LSALSFHSGLFRPVPADTGCKTRKRQWPSAAGLGAGLFSTLSGLIGFWEWPVLVFCLSRQPFRPGRYMRSGNECTRKCEPRNPPKDLPPRAADSCGNRIQGKRVAVWAWRAFVPIPDLRADYARQFSLMLLSFGQSECRLSWLRPQFFPFQRRPCTGPDRVSDRAAPVALPLESRCHCKLGTCAL
jgi:hypothetical protein